MCIIITHGKTIVVDLDGTLFYQSVLKVHSRKMPFLKALDRRQQQSSAGYFPFLQFTGRLKDATTS